MKKISLAILFIAFFLNKVNAQSVQTPIYKTSAGLNIEFGTGGTIVGPELKHYFDAHSAFQTALLFGNGATVISTFYTYNGAIKNASGLNYSLGVGPALGFSPEQNGIPSSTAFFIRPTAGLDYKISNTPLNLTFDWRPTFKVSNGSEFIPARFGIGLRFCF